MKQRTTGIVLFALIAGLTPLAGHAATSGNFVTAAGVPSKWRTTLPITYNIDQGPLGTLSNSRTARVVLAAFDVWQNVPTSNVQFEESDPLDRDVTIANLGDFLDGLPTDVNPVIFDQDGGVLDGLLGQGASLSVVAFGTPLPQSVTPTGTIAQGIIILNGRVTDGLFEPDDLTEADLTRAVVRAIGSFLNVGGSDINEQLIFDGDQTNNGSVPVMHPTLVIGGGSTLTLDDQIAVSRLYPESTFEANTGVISGQVTLADGTTGLQGIAVIARSTTDPVNTVVEAISGAGYLNARRVGSRELAQIGAFEMRVPPGTYTVEYRALQQPIGPRSAIFPLPGGRQFYQEAPSSTAGPDPASATPVTVTAGQVTQLKLVAGGTAAPAAQNIAEAEPNDAAVQAPTLPAAAVITGNVSPNDPAVVSVWAGSGSRDRIEDLYRLVVPEASIVTLHLLPTDRVDLDLYLFGSIPSGAAPNQAGSFTDSTDPESLQLTVGAGVYYVGVTAWDGVATPTPTNYTLTVNVSPLGQLPSRPSPILNQLVVGNITVNSADVSWVTDVDATADVISGPVRQQFGNPTPAREHRIAVTGLVEEAFNRLFAISQIPGEDRDGFPGVYIRTANRTPAEGAAQLNGAMLGAFTDFIDIDNEETATLLAALAIRNTGGNAANVQITSLNVSPGWKLAVPLTQPLAIGSIGSGGTAGVVVRLLRDGEGPDPVALVTGTGTVTGADGAAVEFAIGP